MKLIQAAKDSPNPRLMAVVARSSIEQPRIAPASLRAHRASLPAADSEIEVRIAEELEYLSRRADHLRGSLFMEAGFSHRHVHQMNELKQMRDELCELARLVGTSDRNAAIEEVGEPQLKARLLRRPLQPPGSHLN